jgi:hypothetical protein
MRLLNTKTLRVEEFFDDRVPHYAILSHTWGREEVTLQDIQDLGKARTREGFAKIEGAAVLAATDGYSHVWIDTCCIDKTSSSELTEAINSMYRWYSQSGVCYVYLIDVDHYAEEAAEPDSFAEAFRASRWFQRGWTLQELIAPAFVQFYSKDWKFLGSRSSLERLVSEITGVDRIVLSGRRRPTEISVARKMYWASSRETTRVEDVAYCLLGLFDVNMPLMYGEGAKAFMRLQEEIMKKYDDQSIFAWAYSGEHIMSSSCLLAKSPVLFKSTGNLVAAFPHRRSGRSRVVVASNGYEVEFLITPTSNPRIVSAMLDCQIGPVPGTFPFILLEWTGDGRTKQFSRARSWVLELLAVRGTHADGSSWIGFDPDQISRHRRGLGMSFNRKS